MCDTDTDAEKKRKRSEQSSISDMDNSTKESPLSRKEKKKSKIKENATEVEITRSISGNTEEKKDTNMEDIRKELKSINSGLSKVFTKEDPHFEKFIETTFNNMKQDFLKSITHRIDVLEHRLFEKEKENDSLKEQVKHLDKKLDEKEHQNNQLKRQIESIETKMQERLNDQEQYNRRNNIRISGIDEDEKETAETTMQKVVDTINKNMEKAKVNIKLGDIDIAHRFGKSKDGKRQIIARFVTRKTTDAIMRNKKCMKGTGIFINEDLTKLNQHALMCLKKKLPDEIESVWSIDGRVKYKNKMGNIHTLQFEEYRKWFDMPWP